GSRARPRPARARPARRPRRPTTGGSGKLRLVMSTFLLCRYAGFTPRRASARCPPALKELSMLLRFDPFRELDRAASGARAGFPMDAYRHGDEVVVHLDLPGVDPSSLDLSVHRRVLTISAERPAPAAEGA